MYRTEENYKCGASWLDVLKDPATMHEIDPSKGAFSKAYKVDMGVLPWLGTSEGAGLLQKFGAGVPWLGGITVVATINDIPWEEYGDIVCDVGCGPGAVMLEVKKKYPKLNIICQDLESMVPMVKSVYPN
jgi:methylase of polypeptide subunit release factors